MKKKTITILSVLLIASAAGLLLLYRTGLLHSGQKQALECIRLSEITDVESHKETLSESALNPYADLSVPTYYTQIQDTYFLVDCYHDQILYSDIPDAPLSQWYVMTDEIDKGHTIAGDGLVWLADDTENNSVLVFEKEDGRFVHTQTFPSVGVRPHYIVYDKKTDLFYCLSSMTGEIYVFAREKDSTRMFLTKVMSLPQLYGYYVRSFTIMDDEIYLVSGNSSILRARLSDLSILEEYPVGPEIAGMVQLTRIQDYFYITVSTDVTMNQDYATLLRVRDLRELSSGNYEDLYETYFLGGGTPYYMTSFDGRFYLTEHRIPGHSVWEFEIQENEIKNVNTLFP